MCIENGRKFQYVSPNPISCKTERGALERVVDVDIVVVVVVAVDGDVEFDVVVDDDDDDDEAATTGDGAIISRDRERRKVFVKL
jgi:hypothetical protein